MGILERIGRGLSHAGRRLAGDRPADDDDYWYGPRRTPNSAGVPVDTTTAQQLTTVSACVGVITDTVATMPLLVYREVAAGKERALDHPLWRLLRRRPNRWQSSLAFREMLTGHAALRGIGFAEMIGLDRDGMELIPRHPDGVRALETDSAGFPTLYGVRVAGVGGERPVPASRMFVLQGPWGGRSPVAVHSEAIALGLAVQTQAASYFRNGSRPGGALKSPPGAKLDDEQRKRIKASWEEAHRGVDQSHRVAVLEGGLEWQQIGLSAEDSQQLQTRQFTVAELCRIWRVPPYKVQEYGRATWSNTEQMAIDFVTTCMLPWFRRWEEAIAWHLITDDEPVFAEFLLEGLLRGDTTARFAAYQIATGQRAWMSPNEVRERENLNRLPGLDEVAKEAPGAAPGERKPGAPMREERDDPDDDDPDEDRAVAAAGAPSTERALWAAWGRGVADTLVNAELRELERVKGLEARNPAGFADHCRAFYLGKHHEYVTHRLTEMQHVWRADTPLEAAVAQIVDAGARWATTAPRTAAARRDQILAVLLEGVRHEVAA